MSTSYYRLADPITKLRLHKSTAFDDVILTVWVSGQEAGALRLPVHALPTLARLFAQYQEDNECPLRSYWGGADKGAVVYENGDPLPDEATVISEYGDILLVADVRARHGAKRQDGMPTELLGYQS